MIIVEGPDGAGKTTLINQLKERYGLEVAPRVVSKDAEGLGGAGQAWVEQNLAQGFQYTLFDRHRLISEFIYGPVLRKQQEPGFTKLVQGYLNLNTFYNIVRPIVIYCMPSLEVVKANLAGDQDNTAVVDHIEQIYTGYVQRVAMDWLLRPRETHVWDYKTDYEVELRAIQENPDSPADASPLQYFDYMINRAKERANAR